MCPHLREHAETSADGAEVRRSCTDTAPNDEIVEVPGEETQSSHHFNLVESSEVANQFNSSIELRTFQS